LIYVKADKNPTQNTLKFNKQAKQSKISHIPYPIFFWNQDLNKLSLNFENEPLKIKWKRYGFPQRHRVA